MDNEINPLVSICIPTYNQTEYLRILLKSIADQTYTRYEVIISDDSTSSSVESLIKQFHFNGPLFYQKNSTPLGSPENWNAAIAKSKGKYIKIMHHDDAFTTKDALAKMVMKIESQQLDFVFSDSRVVNVKDGSKSRTHQVNKLRKLLRHPEYLFFGNSIGAPSSLMYNNEKAGSLKYDKRFIWLVDVEFYYRLLSYSKNGAAINEEFILTHDSAEHQLTTQINLNFKLRFEEQMRFFERVAGRSNSFVRFFMQAYMLRMLFQAKEKDSKFTQPVNHLSLIRLYFSSLRFRPFYFSLYIFVRLFDLIRKLIF